MTRFGNILTLWQFFQKFAICLGFVSFFQKFAPTLAFYFYTVQILIFINGKILTQ